MDIDSIEYDKSFTEIGLDSILGVEWVRHINKVYGVSISSTKIYQYPTIIEFTKYLQELLGDSVEEKNIVPEDENVDQLLKQVYEGKVGVESASDLITNELKE